MGRAWIQILAAAAALTLALVIMAGGAGFAEQPKQGAPQVQGSAQAVVNHPSNMPVAPETQEVRPAEKIYFMIVIIITVVVYFILRAIYFRRLKNNKDRQ